MMDSGATPNQRSWARLANWQHSEASQYASVAGSFSASTASSAEFMSGSEDGGAVMLVGWNLLRVFGGYDHGSRGHSSAGARATAITLVGPAVSRSTIAPASDP